MLTVIETVVTGCEKGVAMSRGRRGDRNALGSDDRYLYLRISCAPDAVSPSTEDAMVRKPSSVLVETMVIGDVMVIEE